MLVFFKKSSPKVNLFIAGEQKCGTTSLHELLRMNRHFLSGNDKECQYFNTEKSKNDPGYKIYHSMFDRARIRNTKYVVDGTPDYLRDKDVAEKIFKYNPKAKIVLVFRDPVTRFVSAYNFYFSNILNRLDYVNQKYFSHSERGRMIHEYIKKKGDISLDEFTADELNGNSPICALDRGCYHSSIKRWMEYFPKDSFCILFFENLKSENTFTKEIGFLENFLDLKLEGNFPKENVSLKKEQPDGKMMVQIRTYFSEENKMLENLVGRQLPWN